jgi:hypothetical protein
MTANDLLFWLRAAPFRPFRIVLNSGRTYDIRHPEMLKVGRSNMNEFSYAGGPPIRTNEWKWSSRSRRPRLPMDPSDCCRSG